eukprot:6893203-Pyramimonas_sp.AAC.1
MPARRMLIWIVTMDVPAQERFPRQLGSLGTRAHDWGVGSKQRRKPRLTLSAHAAQQGPGRTAAPTMPPPLAQSQCTRVGRIGGLGGWAERGGRKGGGGKAT